jgi:hypothetical protein
MSERIQIKMLFPTYSDNIADVLLEWNILSWNWRHPEWPGRSPLKDKEQNAKVLASVYNEQEQNGEIDYSYPLVKVSFHCSNDESLSEVL